MLTYDDENQLIGVVITNEFKCEYVYDGKLRKRIMREYEWSSGVWTKTNEVRYVYDGLLVIQERDQNNTPTVTYTRGKDIMGSLEQGGGVGGILARSEHGANPNNPNSHAFYHYDGNGNVVCMINSEQAVMAKYTYDEYGNTISSSGVLAKRNVYRFSSKEFHEKSGLYYYLYRFYDPSLKRWINVDPIGELGGINLYKFCNNDPVNEVDYLGLKPSSFSPEFDYDACKQKADDNYKECLLTVTCYWQQQLWDAWEQYKQDVADCNNFAAEVLEDYTTPDEDADKKQEDSGKSKGKGSKAKPKAKPKGIGLVGIISGIQSVLDFFGKPVAAIACQPAMMAKYGAKAGLIGTASAGAVAGCTALYGVEKLACTPFGDI
jgi:RHS repeat-associated protein